MYFKPTRVLLVLLVMIFFGACGIEANRLPRPDQAGQYRQRSAISKSLWMTWGLNIYSCFELCYVINPSLLSSHNQVPSPVAPDESVINPSLLTRTHRLTQHRARIDHNSLPCPKREKIHLAVVAVRSVCGHCPTREADTVHHETTSHPNHKRTLSD